MPFLISCTDYAVFHSFQAFIEIRLRSRISIFYTLIQSGTPAAAEDREYGKPGWISIKVRESSQRQCSGEGNEGAVAAGRVFQSKRYFLSLAMEDSALSRKVAEAKAKLIEADMISGNFDPSLAPSQRSAIGCYQLSSTAFKHCLHPVAKRCGTDSGRKWTIPVLGCPVRACRSVVPERFRTTPVWRSHSARFRPNFRLHTSPYRSAPARYHLISAQC